MKTYEHTKTYKGMFIVVLFKTTKKPEITSISIENKKMIKYPGDGTLVGSMKEQTIDTHNMDESPKHYARQKKPCVPYDSICKKVYNRQI